MVTGMSGAGKSVAMSALEDIGYFCIDNVPPKLISRFLELCYTSDVDKIAVGVDTRSFAGFGDFTQVLMDFTQRQINMNILFIDANDTVLLNRYKENRRSHPLLNDNGVSSVPLALIKEREILKPILEQAEYVIDTSYTTVKQLKNSIKDFFGDDSTGLKVQLISFGFKHGMPREPDLMFDVRCLPNPFYVPELREETGLNPDVKNYVFNSDESHLLMEKLEELIDFTYPLYEKEGKTRLVIAIGCTGGKHRSVAFASGLTEHLKKQGIPATVSHRDIDISNR